MILKRNLLLSLFIILWAPHQGHALPVEAWKLSPEQLPPLETLEPWALEYSGLDPSQIQRWQRGARWAAALPQVQIGLESKFINQNTNIIQDSISVTSAGITVGPESARLDTDIENNRDFEIKAIWSFDELLFNRDQIYISREARDLFFARSRLLQDLHQAYYQLKTNLIKAQSAPPGVRDPFLELQIEQLMDRINSLTGGRLKAFLFQKSLATKKDPP